MDDSTFYKKAVDPEKRTAAFLSVQRELTEQYRAEAAANVDERMLQRDVPA